MTSSGNSGGGGGGGIAGPDGGGDGGDGGGGGGGGGGILFEGGGGGGGAAADGWFVESVMSGMVSSVSNVGSSGITSGMEGAMDCPASALMYKNKRTLFFDYPKIFLR